MAKIETVAIFGSTGSIGVNTVKVIRNNPDRYRISALCAHKNVELLFLQCQQLQPRFAAMADPQASDELTRRLKAIQSATVVLPVSSAHEQIASSPDIDVVMAGIVGFAGLESTLIAARSGKRILLANKEAMVVAGDLLIAAARQGGATIVPVDSEHNAIFQCLPDKMARTTGLMQTGTNDAQVGQGHEIRSLVLTASGGPFRAYSTEQMESVTVAQALKHPNWSMGAKISVDSATMMNKGLEIIEASYLFGVDEANIEVVVHPQSVIHSMVRYCDGSVLAQLGRADMRTPIAHALAWPSRIDAGVEPLDFHLLGGLEFIPPDDTRFPCLALAREAMRRGNSATGVLNAANEVAVQSFIDERIGFIDVARINAYVLRSYNSEKSRTINDLCALDQKVRRYTVDYIDNGMSPVKPPAGVI